MTAVASLNGKIVSEQELNVSIKDVGFLRGFAIFDFLVAYKNNPFHLTDHIQRLLNSAKVIGLPLIQSRAELDGWVRELLNHSQFKNDTDKTIKIIATGGIGAHTLAPAASANILISVEQYTRPAPCII